jgi:hypothetical protein
MFVMPNSEKSIGTQGEIRFAKDHGIAVFSDIGKILEYGIEYVKRDTIMEAKGLDLLEWDYVMPMLGALLKSQVKDKGADSWKTRLTIQELTAKINRHNNSKELMDGSGALHSICAMADCMMKAWKEITEHPGVLKEIKKKMDEIYG